MCFCIAPTLKKHSANLSDHSYINGSLADYKIEELEMQLSKTSKIILFIFAGRKKFLEIQKHYLKRILNDIEETELHLWNFCRNDADNKYLQELSKELPKTRIFNQYYEGTNPISECSKKVGVLCGCIKCRVGKWSEPYKYYASADNNENTIYVKLDDDIVYIDTTRFKDFIKLAGDQPNVVISANVINNGICAKLNHELSGMIVNKNFIEKDDPLSWWLLCTNADYFRLAHEYFLRNIEAVINETLQPILIPRVRFSINTLSFSSNVMRGIADRLGADASINDEHIISMCCDIIILKGFVTSHFHYSDQRSIIEDVEEHEFIKRYQNLISSEPWIK